MSTETKNGMTPLTSEEASVFERRLEMAREELQEIDRQIENELQRARERISALQAKRDAPLKVYGAACTMLGIDNELEDSDP